MATEIERKFLVVGDSWREDTISQAHLVQAYLFSGPDRSMRVRIENDSRATLCIKFGASPLLRDEFEYPIPAADAETMLSQLGADGLRLEKTRYLLRHEGHEWSVDVFGGALTGLIMAEIELTDPDETFARPDWLGAEVTHDLRYRNAALAEHGAPQ